MSGRRSNTLRDSRSKKAFNARLICFQIVAMQCFHYLFLGFMIQLNHLFWGSSISLDRIFTDSYLRIWHVSGWPDLSATVLSCLFGSLLMAIIVEKSKKVLDFSVTLFMIHFSLCILYPGGGLPATWDWYIVHIFGTIIMALMGEHLCARVEMQEIPLLTL